jgi:serine protease AprX
MKFAGLAFGLISVFMLCQEPLLAGEKLWLKTGPVDLGATPGVFDSLDLNRYQAHYPSPYHVIQFHSRIKIKELNWLKMKGAEVINYLPEDALTIRIENAFIANTLREDKRVRALSIYQPYWKVSPEISNFSPFFGKSWIAVKVFSLKEAEALSEFLISKHVLFTQNSEKRFSVFTDSFQIGGIADLPGVEWLEIEYPYRTFEFEIEPELGFQQFGDYSNLTGFESGTKIMGFEPTWSRGLTGRGQVVGVADTGLDTGERATLSGDFFNLTSAFGWAKRNGVWSDSNGHGTHVAGSILGTGQSSQGRIRGGAYESKLVVQALMDEMGKFKAPGAKALLDEAYAQGVRVHSNSWGNEQPNYDLRAREFDEYIWNHPDLLLVFAAGNAGVDGDEDGKVDPGSVGSPGIAKNVLTVGASENYVTTLGSQKSYGENSMALWPVAPIVNDKLSDNPNGLAAFSSRGPTGDGRRKPNLVGPGTNILSSKSQHPGASTLWGAYNSAYVFCGGTSMATPLVAGAAAVVRQFLIEKKRIESPSAAVLKAVLMHSAQDLFPGQYGLGAGQEILTKRPNSDQGYGRTNVAAATDDSLEVYDDPVGVGTGETKELRVSLHRGDTLSVTLNYTDAPGAPNSAAALVNDLDLIVLSPGGQRIASVDRINNDETLLIPIPSPGNYVIQVFGHNVPMGKNGRQPFAMVLSR